METERREYGNLGVAAEIAYENYEFYLMMTAAVLIGGVMSALVTAQSGFAMGVWTTAFVAVVIAVSLTAAEVLVELPGRR